MTRAPVYTVMLADPAGPFDWTDCTEADLFGTVVRLARAYPAKVVCVSHRDDPERRVDFPTECAVGAAELAAQDLRRIAPGHEGPLAEDQLRMALAEIREGTATLRGSPYDDDDRAELIGHVWHALHESRYWRHVLTTTRNPEARSA